MYVNNIEYMKVRYLKLNYNSMTLTNNNGIHFDKIISIEFSNRQN